MKIIGITGGIGSGKSEVSKIFEGIGIPVLNLDIVAKNIMSENKDVINSLKETFGEDIYEENILNRKLLASRVFINKIETEKLNNIVHPAVKLEVEKWKNSLHISYPYCMVESAIMIESGFYKMMDLVIGVYCNKAERIKRTMKRDSCSRKEVLQRMKLQMSEQKKMKYYDFIIRNEDNNMHDVISAIHDINEKMNKG